MKRTFCIFAAALLIALSGCSKKQDVVTVPATQGINCTFSADYNGFEVKGKMKISENLHTAIEIEKPTSLKGMKINVNDDTVTVSYLGLTTSMKTSDSPQTAFAGLIVSALKSAAASVGVTATETDDGYKLSGKCSAGAYTVLLDKSLRPVSINMDAISFHVQFSDFI